MSEYSGINERIADLWDLNARWGKVGSILLGTKCLSTHERITGLWDLNARRKYHNQSS